MFLTRFNVYFALGYVCFNHTEVADTTTSKIKESASVSENASDNTNGLVEKNLEKNINEKNIVSSATQLSPNQNKIFPGKVIVYISIPENFVLPSAYKNSLRTKTQTLSIKAKSYFNSDLKSSPK